MNNNILIIIDVDTFSLNTIEKAYKISNSIGGRLNILFLKYQNDKRVDEIKFIEGELKKIYDMYNVYKYRTGLFDLSDFSLIKDFCSKENISLIVMANYKLPWYEELYTGSISNIMAYDFLEQDLLLINSKAPQFEKKEYHNGKLAWLVKANHDIIVSFKPTILGIKGIYFKEKATDFEHGIFLEEIKERRKGHEIYKISDNKVIQ